MQSYSVSFHAVADTSAETGGGWIRSAAGRSRLAAHLAAVRPMWIAVLIMAVSLAVSLPAAVPDGTDEEQDMLEIIDYQIVDTYNRSFGVLLLVNSGGTPTRLKPGDSIPAKVSAPDRLADCGLPETEEGDRLRVTYLGERRTRIQHLASGRRIEVRIPEE